MRARRLLPRLPGYDEEGAERDFVQKLGTKLWQKAPANSALGQLKGSFSTAARLERAIGLPVAGSISQVRSAAQQAVEKQRLKWFAAASGGLAGVCLLLIAVEFVQRGMA